MRKVGAHRYQNTQNTTASKERIMVILFQTALKHMRTAKVHYDDKEIMSAEILVRKALDIIWELQDTLNPSVAPELATNLSDLYSFVNLRLLNTLTSKTTAPLNEAERVFAPLVDAFEKAVELVKNPPLAAQAG